MILRFYVPFLRSEFVLHFPCRVKIVILTTLTCTGHLGLISSQTEDMVLKLRRRQNKLAKVCHFSSSFVKYILQFATRNSVSSIYCYLKVRNSNPLVTIEEKPWENKTPDKLLQVHGVRNFIRIFSSNSKN
jgi:hypothetical protein